MATTLAPTLDQRYAAAHQAHYHEKNLKSALDLYRAILVTDPGTPEAGYARSQIHNIVRTVVPDETLFAAQMELAIEQLAHREPPSASRPPVGR